MTRFQETISAYPPGVQRGLTALRELILETADETPGVGPLTEALKWGQHSFLTAETRSGTTVRIDRLRGEPNKVAVFFHCQTGLIDHFRDIYGDRLTFIGNRAITFEADQRLPTSELKHCLGLALTHHLRKKRSRRSTSQ